MNGFILLGVRDLIELDNYAGHSESSKQYEEEFRLQLQRYLEGKGAAPSRAAIKYLIDDCLRELRKAEGDATIMELLKRFQVILNTF